MIPPRQTYRLEWDSWQSCMVYHLHVARLHSTIVAYSPLHTMIHSIRVAILPHTFCIPSAVKERSWRANGSSHFGAPAYFLKRHSLPEFGLRGEMIISSKQNHHDQQKCLSRKIKSLRIWRCQKYYHANSAWSYWSCYLEFSWLTNCPCVHSFNYRDKPVNFVCRLVRTQCSWTIKSQLKIRHIPTSSRSKCSKCRKYLEIKGRQFRHAFTYTHLTFKYQNEFLLGTIKVLSFQSAS